MEWFGNFVTAVMSGLILGLAYRYRPSIGQPASNRAGLAAALLIFNSIAIAGLSGFANQMADDWTELGEHVPAAWLFGQNLLEMVSNVLPPVALALLAAAVFAPRVARADDP